MQLPESSATQNSQTYVHLQNSKKTRRFKKLVSIDAATRILSYSELSNICPPPKLEKKTRRFKRTRPSVTLSIMQLECNILKPTLSSWLQPRVLILRWTCLLCDPVVRGPDLCGCPALSKETLVQGIAEMNWASERVAACRSMKLLAQCCVVVVSRLQQAWIDSLCTSVHHLHPPFLRALRVALGTATITLKTGDTPNCDH